jgi:phosphoribosylformimino-5-aminoimidazole carboxamide ribonucleotide (ProFAR) isomerase
MLVVPSLDLPTGFSRGMVSQIVETIQEWERSGFSRVQLVLGTGDGDPGDLRLLEDVLRDIHIASQVAGRIESSEDLDAILGAGPSAVVLGPRGIDDLDWLHSVETRFPDQLMVTTPMRERRTRSRGAVRTLPLDLRDMASELSGLRLAGLVVELGPDIEVGHPELALLEDVAEDVPFAVQVSGGAPALGTLRDLEFRGIAGTIISAAHLAAQFDGQTLGRSFSD